MAVYKHTYQRYTGPLTPARTRFMILARYAYKDLFRSKFFSLFFQFSFLPPLGAAVLIYLRHNATVLSAFKIPMEQLLPLNEGFFLGVLSFQCSLAFLLTAFVGPGLISPDLVNNALPLYLSRPLSRTEYVLGKMTVLAALLSVMTWIPVLLLFLFQSNMEGMRWMTDHWRIATGSLFGSWLWIGTISLLALALSAWVKWKPVAGALLFGVFFAGAAFGAAINGILDTDWGNLIMLSKVLETVWTWLFFSDRIGNYMPISHAVLALLALHGICLFLLSRKIRAYEVVR